MDGVPERYNSTIGEAIEHLISRAENRRGLDASDIRPRIFLALKKYLLENNEHAEHPEVKDFIDEIRADDLCLIIACENNDEKAWEDLVGSFDSTVKSAARRLSKNDEDAEDLAGSIWAELYGLRQDTDGNKKSKLAYYSGRGSLAGWLRAVVSQLAVDQYRKQSKFVQIEEDRDFENLVENASLNLSSDGVVSRSENPEELFIEGQTSGDVSAALKAAIAALEPEDRLIIKLYYFDELKLKDIARTFGYHEATASRKLVRVQSEIRKGVEVSLKTEHGWSDSEVKRHLADTASKLGISFEKILSLLMIAALLQELSASGVL
ncbi:MAG: sigma-70 family RNA polymerase sigma factor [Pyrinomonadaceae bacterium]